MVKGQTELVKKLNLAGPLILAPLSGGPGTAALAAAVSNAGGLGFLGGAYMSATDLQTAIQQTKILTTKTFGVNLFVPSQVPKVSEAQKALALKVTQTYRDELQLATPNFDKPAFEDFNKLMTVVFAEKPAVFSFTFGLLDKSYLQECHRLGIYTIGTATNLEEALQLQDSGVNAIVAQGKEAGGHRGMFDVQQSDSDVVIEDLTKSLVNELKVPVIAAGGLMTGKDIAKALSWGAQAAQLGTAFMLCPEAGTSAPYRQALREAKGKVSCLTRVFSGRIARGLENRFILEMENQNEAILPWPVQNAFTRDIRQKAAQMGKAEFLSLWAGTSVAFIREMPAPQLVETLYSEFNQA
ncbi:NAD(P)H-dependent flavin oxidoreductase [Bdellovibrio sp. HCB337]|uniref:NAD(P)H-dependent flavin oxidoreductase n=1 Tax=Bdellovibrio sp. HCB337 TaxID=3394358 RepID=UPI0039A40D4D